MKNRYLHMTHVNRYKLLSMPVLCKKDVVEDIKPRPIAKKGQMMKTKGDLQLIVDLLVVTKDNTCGVLDSLGGARGSRLDCGGGTRRGAGGRLGGLRCA